MTKAEPLRILIALESTDIQPDVFDALPLLTSGNSLDLTVIYIQDEDTLRAAALPVVREISLSGELRELDAERMLGDFQTLARRIERAFADMAHKHRLAHRFHTVLGRHAEELRKAAALSDFLVVSRPLRPLGLRPRPGRELTGLLERNQPVLLINEPWASGRSVVVLHDDAPDVPALTLADRYARAAELQLIILCPGHAEAYRQQLARRYPGAQVICLPAIDEETLARACAHHDARLLVVPGHVPLNWRALVPRLVDRVPCSILRLPESET